MSLPRVAGSDSASRTRPTRTCCSLSVAENLFLAAPSDRPADVRTHERVGGRTAAPSSTSASRRPRRRGASPSPSDSSSRSSRRCSSEPKVLLLDEPTTALGPEDVERLHALVASREPSGVGIVVRQPPPAGGPRASRTGSRVLRDGVCQGTFDAASMAEERLVALMIGRPLELAFPPRRRASDASARCCSRSTGCSGGRFGPIDLDAAPRRDRRDRRRRGQRAGAVPAGASPAPSRPPERSTCNGARSSTRGRRSAALARRDHDAERRPDGRVAVPRPRRASNASIQVLGRFSKAGLLRRGRRDARSRASSSV